MSLWRREIKRYLSALGIPRAYKQKIYCVDTENGDDSWLGDHWDRPFLTLTYAESRCVADQHDAVLFIARDTADEPAATIGWDKDFTHLIGCGNNLPGIGQRCRVQGTAALDLTSVIDFGGKGNIIRNMGFFNWTDAAAATEAVNLTGDRYEFTNVQFSGMGHATPAGRTDCYSLGLLGAHENIFRRCWIGLDTINRSDANAELVINASSKNFFEHCKFVSQSSTNGKFLVRVEVDTHVGLNSFEDCLFYNFTPNMTAANWLDDAFNINGAPATTYAIDLCRCRLLGVTGWADITTHIYGYEATPTNAFGIPATPAA